MGKQWRQSATRKSVGDEVENHDSPSEIGLRKELPTFEEYKALSNFSDFLAHGEYLGVRYYNHG
jgi:hypothetical protein